MENKMDKNNIKLPFFALPELLYRLQCAVTFADSQTASMGLNVRRLTGAEISDSNFMFPDENGFLLHRLSELIGCLELVDSKLMSINAVLNDVTDHNLTQPRIN